MDHASAEKAVELEGDGCTDSSWCIWNSLEGIGKDI